MPTNNTAEEEEDVVENYIDSFNSPNSQQLISARNRPHLSRTGKEGVEEIELETINSTNANLLTNQRSSNRLTKKLRTDPSPVDPTLKKTVAIKPNTSIGCKTRRPWELWSVEDKNAFFEALCEYGKDFESIQSYIAQRSKKKGIAANMIKNKDQVRHFYYRTWHKISKFLEITGCVRKQTRELYGLINYAELRKKIGGLNEKNSQKLNELVFSGVTTVKHKGKKLRIKTPVCRALKKLNNVSETNEPEIDKMPKDVVVEFRPHTNFAWYQVQKLSQNPRIRTKVNLQKRLRPVLEHLQKRWKPNRLKKKEQILTSLPTSAPEENLCDPSPVLRVKPGRDMKTSLLSLSAMNITSSSDVCLQKYLKFAQKTTFDDAMAMTKKDRLKPKSFGDSSVIESNAQKGDLVDETTTFELLENNLPMDNSECCGDPPQVSKSSGKIFSDENSCTGILTPPKSVPEHEIGPDQALQEAQRSLSLLSSMLNSAKLRNANISLEDEEERSAPSESIGVSNAIKSSIICDEVSCKSDENSDDQSFAQCSSQTNQEASCVLSEDVSEKQDDSSSHSDEKVSQLYLNQDNDGCETMTLSQLLNQDIEKQALSPDSSHCMEPCESDVNGLIKLGKLCKDDEHSFQKAVKQGWTAEEAEFLTFGELYLMFGNPSKIILEYEFEQPDAVDNNLSDDETTYCSADSIAEMSKMLENMFRYACGLFSEDKNKLFPLSPTTKNVLLSRVNTASQTSGKQTLRHAVKAPTLKTNIRIKPSILIENTLVDSDISQSPKENVTSVSESISTGSKTTSTSSDTTSSSDKHVFVVPVAAAPRSVKPNQDSLREEIGKLLPGTRRGCRVRRKPLVVQRPLLPRDRMRTIAGPRPMTVVHFVPSGSQLTAVIPSSCPGPENKINLPSTNKVVKILSTGSPIDMHPLQVPVINQVCPDPGNNIALQTSSIGSPHVMINPSQRDPIHLIDDANMSCSLASMNSSNTVKPTNINENASMLDSHSVSDVTLPSQNIDQSLNLDILSSSACEDSTECGNPVSSLGSEINLVEDSTKLSSNLSSIVVSSFLKMPLNKDFELSPLKEKSTSSSSPPITPYTECDPAFSSKQNTPPDSPTHQPFRINSPEIQWLNGESAELSLNTFLNSMESPNKTSSANSVNLSSDNSNLDPIVRLAPVVDSQVRCLLDECSIDFITKFEDLADVINSSCSDSKPT